MNALLIQQIQTIVRRYWQHTVLVVLGLCVLLQVVSWGSTLMDLKRIDHLIATAQDPTANSSEDNHNENEAQNNRNRRGGNQSDRDISKDIFRRETIPYQLSAIFMDQAVIDNSVVKVGERVGKAEVKEIGLDFVVIQEDGKDNSKTLTLFEQRGGSRIASNNNARGGGRNRPASRTPGSRGSSSDSGNQGNIPDPPSQTELTIENVTWAQIQDMSPQERRQHWENLNDSQRQELRNRFSDQIRSERGGRGGGPGGRFAGSIR